MGNPMNLFRPVPNANKKKQFCQIVKIRLFNECRKNGTCAKTVIKRKKKTPKKRRETGGNQTKTAFFFHLTTWQGTY